MQRRSFLKRAAWGAGGAFIAGPALAQDTPMIHWRLASGFSQGTALLHGAADTLARYVSMATGGQFLIEAAEPAADLLGAVQRGELECGHGLSSAFYAQSPALCFDAAVPFGLNTRQMNAWMRHGDGLTLTREAFQQFNVVNFPCGQAGAQMGGWFRQEIRSLDDLKALKVSLSPLAGAVLERLGARVVQSQDMYAALEKGEIDAASSFGPCEDEKLQLHKVARNYYFPGWGEGALQLSLYVNQDAYKSLPVPFQTVLAQAANAVNDEMLAAFDAENPPALRRLVGEGAQLKAFPKAVLEGCYAASAALYQELGEQDALFKRLHDSMNEFRTASAPWLRMSEGGFDAFMNTTRMQ